MRLIASGACFGAVVRLLFDENLSFRLVRELADVYPNSAHVRVIGLFWRGGSSCMGLRSQEGMLTSKDTGFYQRSLVFGAPPKVVWLRIGNISTAAIATLLRQRSVAVRRFYEGGDATFLLLS